MKTTFNYKITILFLAFMVLGVTSCVEEPESIEGKGKSRFRLSSSDEYAVSVIEATSTNYTLIDIWRDANGASALNAAASVSVAVDDQIITDWNTANGTSFTPLPTSLYSMDGPAIDFDGGAYNITVEFTPDPGDPSWDYLESYAIGVKLTSPSSGYEITNGEDKAIIAVVVKNPYEADYAVTGYFFHPGAPRAIADSKYLYTLGPSTCEAGLGDLYGAGFWFDFDVSGTNTLINWVAIGSTNPSGSGFMTMDNPAGIDYSLSLPDYPGTDPWLKDDYNNTYNPATSTFLMHYGYKGGGVFTQSSYSRQVYEKWVRK